MIVEQQQSGNRYSFQRSPRRRLKSTASSPG